MRTIPDPGFAGDAGAPDPGLRAALLAYDETPAAVTALVDALARARVLVPVVAVATAVEPGGGSNAGGLAREKSTDMALVTVAGRDGRRALPVFSGLDALRRWRSDARPVPVEGRRAAVAGLAEGAEALLLDLAGPARAVVAGPALRALAEGRSARPAHADPEVLAAVRDAAVGLPGVRAVQVGPSPRADLQVRVEVAGADERAVGTALAERLAAVDLLRARLSRGVDVVAARGEIQP